MDEDTTQAPEPSDKPSEKALKLEGLLSHKPLGRVLALEEVASEFALIRDTLIEARKRVPDEADFAAVGQASGTHLVKLNSARAEVGQHLLKIEPAGRNRAPELFPSLDAKKAPVAKIVFRPLEIRGAQTRSLADHIRNPDDNSPVVLKAFAASFGQESLEALRTALLAPMPPVTQLPAAEFPIIFLPRPGGGDLQVTPLSPAEANIKFWEVTERYFRKQEKDAPPVARGKWLRQHVSGKPQNISSAIGPRRTRFLATMPTILDQRSAELHRFVHGGSFPRWRDPSVGPAVEAYANLLDQPHSNADIRAGLDRRADALIEGAKVFVDEILAEASHDFPDKELRPAPGIDTIILRRSWPKDGADRARRVLTGEHFRDRLKAAGLS
ncbi:MAG: hypothetical protein MRY63_11290 [Neomegalonema sp.]|nr:hypothetical protein [Neomegalonema sp.]